MTMAEYYDYFPAGAKEYATERIQVKQLAQGTIIGMEWDGQMHYLRISGDEDTRRKIVPTQDIMTGKNIDVSSTHAAGLHVVTTNSNPMNLVVRSGDLQPWEQRFVDFQTQVEQHPETIDYNNLQPWQKNMVDVVPAQQPKSNEVHTLTSQFIGGLPINAKRTITEQGETIEYTEPTNYPPHWEPPKQYVRLKTSASDIIKMPPADVGMVTSTYNPNTPSIEEAMGLTKNTGTFAPGPTLQERIKSIYPYGMLPTGEMRFKAAEDLEYPKFKTGADKTSGTGFPNLGVQGMIAGALTFPEDTGYFFLSLIGNPVGTVKGIPGSLSEALHDPTGFGTGKLVSQIAISKGFEIAAGKLGGRLTGKGAAEADAGFPKSEDVAKRSFDINLPKPKPKITASLISTDTTEVARIMDDRGVLKQLTMDVSGKVRFKNTATGQSVIKTITGPLDIVPIDIGSTINRPTGMNIITEISRKPSKTAYANVVLKTSVKGKPITSELLGLFSENSRDVIGKYAGVVRMGGKEKALVGSAMANRYAKMTGRGKVSEFSINAGVSFLEGGNTIFKRKSGLLPGEIGVKSFEPYYIEKNIPYQKSIFFKERLLNRGSILYGYTEPSGKIKIDILRTGMQDTKMHEMLHSIMNEKGLSLQGAAAKKTIRADFVTLGTQKIMKLNDVTKAEATKASRMYLRDIERTYPKRQVPEEFLANFVGKFPEEINNPTTETGRAINQLFARKFVKQTTFEKNAEVNVFAGVDKVTVKNLRKSAQSGFEAAPLKLAGRSKPSNVISSIYLETFASSIKADVAKEMFMNNPAANTMKRFVVNNPEPQVAKYYVSPKEVSQPYFRPTLAGQKSFTQPKVQDVGMNQNPKSILASVSISRPEARNNSALKQLTIPRNVYRENVKPASMLRIRNNVRPAQLQIPMQGVQQRQRQEQRQQPKPAAMTRQAALPRIRPVIPVRMKLAPVRPPFIPGEAFGAAQPKARRPRAPPKKFTAIYRPQIFAILAGIKGKQPRKLTGLEIRPIVVTKRKRK